MIRYFLITYLLLTATTALGDEINGLNSRAIDISVSFSASRGQHGATFVSVDAEGRPNGITIQSRYTDLGSNGWVACTTTVPLPQSARQVSHPAFSSSGWLFVSASANSSPTSEGWKLYAARHSLLTNQCTGWSSWMDLGHFPGRPVNSAPDAIVAYGAYTYVFVTDRNGYIDYRMFDSDAQQRRNPTQRWSEWRSLAAINRNERNQYLASSKPAAAIYNDGVERFHVFWHDVSHRRINHVSGIVSIAGLLVESAPDSREFHQGLAARTACSAGPEITAPSPLFVVCGNNRYDRTSEYSIAHYRNPRSNWAGSTVVWESRSTYGGFSAPSVGRTFLAASIPFMFVTFGEMYCPEPTLNARPLPPRISSTCTESGPWAIQNRYSALLSVGWERRAYESPARAGKLYPDESGF
jgi:hypothetical protein